MRQDVMTIDTKKMNDQNTQSDMEIGPIKVEQDSSTDSESNEEPERPSKENGASKPLKPRKRKCFSVEEKMEIIRRLEAGERNGSLAKEFGVNHTTIVTINKSKEKIKDLFNRNVLKQKRVRASTHDEIDKALLQWFLEQPTQGIPISGPILQEKANFLAKQMKVENFSCSSSWISRFKVRHNIHTANGQSSSLQTSDEGEWLTRVWPKLREGFNDEEIFYAEETELFYKLTPDRAFKPKGENCQGEKLVKDKITVLVAANMSGKVKKKLFVIGKSKQPRCFKNVASLPVDYYSNCRAWMTYEFFRSWVRNWNAELKQQKKKILLLVHNCPAHPIISDLTNITLAFLPQNTISALQGIVRVIKSTFRRNLELKIISNMEEGNDENEPKIKILDAILMVNDGWQQLSPATIANFFKQSGLVEENLDELHSSDDIHPSVWAKALNDELPISSDVMNEFTFIDNNVAAYLDDIDHNLLDDGQDCDDSMEDPIEDVSAPSVLEALKAAEILNRFVHSNFNDESLSRSISRLNNAVRDCFYKSKTTGKQAKSSDCLKRRISNRN